MPLHSRARTCIAGLSVATTLSLAVVPATAFSPGDRITKDGLGDIRIGMTVSQVEAELGSPLDDLNNNAGDGSCATATLGQNVYGLFTGSTLARIYVGTSRYRTRKGIHVRSSARDVFKAYGRNVRSSRHAYTAGRYLKVTMGHRRLVFETSASGRVVSISTGRKPEVDYIEGCA